jgi:hypothetical protein
MRRLHKLAWRASRRAARVSFSRQKTVSYLLMRRLAAVLLPGKEKIKVARELSGKTSLRQLADRLILFFGYRIDARDYYDLSLFMPDILVRAGEFQCPHDIKLFNASLNQNDTTRITEDKQLFNEFCLEHGIPTPDIVASLEPGITDKKEFTNRLAPIAVQQALFFKPRFGYKGAGVGRLKFENEGLWTVDFGKGNQRRENWDTTLDILLSAGEPLVFQKALETHPSLSRFNPNTLHTLRITTFMDGSTIRILSIVLRIGLGDSTTDNVSIGGLGAPVDLETGQLANGTQERMDVLPFSLRYVGDDEIDLQSVQLPFFQEAVETAKSIHAALPKMFSLGHDIAILPDGPVAVETNHIWGDFQKFHNLGYGADRTYIANLLDRCQCHPDFT